MNDAQSRFRAVQPSASPRTGEGIPFRTRRIALAVIAAVAFTGDRLAAGEGNPTPGVTVLVHGFMALGGAGTTPWDYWGGGDNMEKLLRRFRSGLVWEYDPESGLYTDVTRTKLPLEPVGWGRAYAGHQILLFDWGKVSEDQESGQAEAAADALFASLMRFEIDGEPVITTSPYAAQRPLHFVGHSRGTVVVSETVQRLGRFNIHVNYVTYLDIHDFGHAAILKDQYFHDPAVQVWDNVDYADAFFQWNSPFMCDTNPPGRPLAHLPQTLQHEITEETKLDDEGCDDHGRPHAYVKDIYWQTVAGNSTRGFDRWFDNGGFDQGRHPGILRVDCRKAAEAKAFVWNPADEREYADRNDVPPVIFNGDFQLPDLDRQITGAAAGSLAGWSFFGGGGKADLRPPQNNPLPGAPVPQSYLALYDNLTVASHNRFFLPTGAREIRFDMSVPFVPNTPLFDHTLEVKIGNRLLRRFTVSKTSDFEPRTVNLRDQPDLLGGVNHMTFELFTAPGPTTLTAKVYLDNIRIATTYPDPVDVDVDSDGDGLFDGEESKLGTDPTLFDTDSDGLGDGQEVRETHTHPTNRDTDGDAAPDGEEVALGTDPLDPKSVPPTVAYAVEAGITGNEDFTGSLGMDFRVNAAVRVIALGAFDSGSDGFASAITVELWSRNDNGTPDVFDDDSGGERLAEVVLTPEEPGTLRGGNRFKDLEAPLRLAPGAYVIVASGYGHGDSNGNLGGDPDLPLSVAVTSLISFVGNGHYGDAGVYPGTQDNGPANRYAAGTFTFSTANVTDPNDPPVILSMARSETSVTITWSGISGSEYKVERSADMQDWETVETVIPEGKVSTYTDDQSSGRRLFYRVRRVS
jgi:Bacterial TSP3 repeat